MNKITVLFEGDSLTANRLDKTDASIGHGYPFLSLEMVKKEFPQIEFVSFNEAVFGSRVLNVKERINAEIEKYHPDIVTLFVGVNDALSGTLAEFEVEYASILGTIKASGAKLIVIEPYLNYHDIYGRYLKRNNLVKINEYIKNLIIGRADAFIPLDGLFFDEFLRNEKESYFVDGLHLSPRGCEFIANIHAQHMVKIIKENFKECL